MLFYERLSYHEDFHRILKTEKKLKIRRLGDFIDDLWGFCYRIEHSILCLMKLVEKKIRMQTKNFYITHPRYPQNYYFHTTVNSALCSVSNSRANNSFPVLWSWTETRSLSSETNWHHQRGNKRETLLWRTWRTSYSAQLVQSYLVRAGDL